MPPINKAKIQKQIETWEKILSKCTNDEEKAFATKKVADLKAKLSVTKPPRAKKKKTAMEVDNSMDIDMEVDEKLVKHKKDALSDDFFDDVEL